MPTLENDSALTEAGHLAKKTDWGSPVAILTVAAIALGFYAGGHHMKTGLFLGVGASLGVLILLVKCPLILIEICDAHPLMADIILSGLATWFINAYFGQGLTLGISAITTALILSWGIPSLTKRKLRPAPSVPMM